MWRKYANKQKMKRNNQKDPKEANLQEIIVQRMSSEVCGKQQKYSRIGAREYVPFSDYDELTIQNIIKACQKHYKSSVEPGMRADVLAGERGPSCSKVSQLSDTKTFFVRFVADEEKAKEDKEAPTSTGAATGNDNTEVKKVNLSNFMKLGI